MADHLQGLGLIVPIFGHAVERNRSIANSDGIHQPTEVTAVSALLLSIPSAADRLGIGRTTLYKLANDGVVPTVQVGSRRLIRDADLVAYAESLPVSRPQDAA
jgi:excisionase family DNA binding protein